MQYNIKQVRGATQGSILFLNSNGTLSENNSQFYWDSTNNRLGVGTSSPTNLLHIYRNTNDFLYEIGIDNINSGNSAASAILIRSNSGKLEFGQLSTTHTTYTGYGQLSDTFIRSGVGSRNLNIITDASNIGKILMWSRLNPVSDFSQPSLSIDGSKIGVGTHSPAHTLDIHGASNTYLRVKSSGVDSGIIIDANEYPFFGLYSNGVSNFQIQGQAGTAVYFRTKDAVEWRNPSNNTYFSIGNAATNNATFTLRGDVTISATNSTVPLTLQRESDGTGTLLKLISNDGGFDVGQEMRIDFQQQTALLSRMSTVFFGGSEFGFNFHGYDSFFTNPLLTIRGNGNIGIGTASPADKLEVNGSMRLSTLSHKYKIGIYEALWMSQGAGAANVSIGNGNTINDADNGGGIAIGSSVITSSDGIAIGLSARVDTGNSDGIAIGRSARAYGNIRNLAIGRDSYAQADNAWAIGSYCFATQNDTIILGNAHSGNKQDVGIATATVSARLHISGKSTTSSDYALKVENSSLNPLMWVRNDGAIAIGTNTITDLVTIYNNSFDPSVIIKGGPSTPGTAALKIDGQTESLIRFLQNGTENANLQLIGTSLIYRAPSGGHVFRDFSTNNTTMFISNTGNLTVGGLTGSGTRVVSADSTGKLIAATVSGSPSIKYSEFGLSLTAFVTQTATHSLGTTAIIAQAWDTSTGEVVYVTFKNRTANTVDIVSTSNVTVDIIING